MKPVDDLAELRRTTGLSQSAVAAKWGRPQTQVSAVETNVHVRSLETIAGYCNALGATATLTVTINSNTWTLELCSADTTDNEPSNLLSALIEVLGIALLAHTLNTNQKLINRWAAGTSKPPQKARGQILTLHQLISEQRMNPMELHQWLLTEQLDGTTHLDRIREI